MRRVFLKGIIEKGRFFDQYLIRVPTSKGDEGGTFGKEHFNRKRELEITVLQETEKIATVIFPSEGSFLNGRIANIPSSHLII